MKFLNNKFIHTLFINYDVIFADLFMRSQIRNQSKNMFYYIFLIYIY